MKHKQLTFRDLFLLVKKSLPTSLASPPSRRVLTITVFYCFVISLRSTAAYCNAGMVYLGFKCKCSLERSTNIYLEGGGGGRERPTNPAPPLLTNLPPPSPTVYFKPSRPPNESSISTTILRIKMGGCKKSTQSRVKAVLLYYAKFFRSSRTVIILDMMHRKAT